PPAGRDLGTPPRGALRRPGGGGGGGGGAGQPALRGAHVRIRPDAGAGEHELVGGLELQLVELRRGGRLRRGRRGRGAGGGGVRGRGRLRRVIGEVLDILGGLVRLTRRSPTLDGSVPLRVARACLPLLEGNAYGLQLVLTRPLTVRRRLRHWQPSWVEGGADV